jgi:hypothetical protein
MTMKNDISYFVFVVIFGLIVLLKPLHVSGGSSTFLYSGTKANAGNLLLDPVNGGIRIHDREYAAKFFSDQQFFTMKSDVVEIAIPKKISSEQWIYAGQLYKNLGKSTMRWMGKSLDIYRITVSAVGFEIVAVYNVRLGIVGFEIVDDGVTKKIFLRGRCGYAALDC